MSELKVGASHSMRITVDEGNSISFLGEELRVYATPAMVHDVEYCCREGFGRCTCRYRPSGADHARLVG